MTSDSKVALERRSKPRFPLRLSVRFRALSEEPSALRVGRTLNMSSGGFLIASDEANIRTGSRLLLTVEWPFLLHGVTPLQLIVSGRVTRCIQEEFAVKVDDYQFKTKKRQP